MHPIRWCACGKPTPNPCDGSGPRQCAAGTGRAACSRNPPICSARPAYRPMIAIATHKAAHAPSATLQLSSRSCKAPPTAGPAAANS
ncbi:hypothetical protein G6F66_015655 [Rhizopus arrhizus]|nr:hypothetical protein G6F66_015655 [Rhizopus arrhizus]